MKVSLLLTVEFLLLGSVVSGGLALLSGRESWKVLGGCLVELRIKQRHRKKPSLCCCPLSSCIKFLWFNLSSLG